MGIFTRNKTKESDQSRGHQGRLKDTAGDTINLYLYLADTEWRAQFVTSNGSVISDPIGENLILSKNKGASFADCSEIIQRALKQVTIRQVRNIGSVSIVLSDPGISLLDNLDNHFSSANVAKIRQYGMESLNCAEVSYGFSSLGTGSVQDVASTRPDRGVFGFANVAVLRQYLGQLERLAVKTVLIAPVIQNTIFDAQLHTDEAVCGIYIGARSTQVVVCNATQGSVTTRKIPVGIYSLVDAVAQANNVSVADALTALTRRNCLSQVLLDSENTALSKNHVPGQFERILGEPVRRLGNEIDRTLQFFDVQRMGGRPDAIKIFGAIAGIQGLTDWLGQRLGVETTDANASILNDLIPRPRTEGLNLLEGAKNSLITLGRVNYYWDKDRFLPEHEMDSDEMAEEKAAAAIVSGKPVDKRDTATPASTYSGIFSRLKLNKEPQRPRSGRQRGERRGHGRGQGRQPHQPDSEKSGRAGYVLLALFAFVSLFGGYKTFVSPKINEFTQLTNVYLGTLRQNASLRTKMIAEMAGNPIKRPIRSNHDKVLWTEKFLALGCYASKAVWLTDVYLTTSSTTAAGKLKKIQKLTIKGAVLPSANGHLLQISDYIRRLEEDKRSLFMADFKRITFEGATVDYDDVEEIIRFTIEGWYDKNKPKPPQNLIKYADLSVAGCSPDKDDAVARKEALLEAPGRNDTSGTSR